MFFDVRIHTLDSSAYPLRTAGSDLREPISQRPRGRPALGAVGPPKTSIKRVPWFLSSASPLSPRYSGAPLSPHHRHGRSPVPLPTIDSDPPPAKSGDSGENGALMPVVAELLQRLCGTLESTNMLVIPQTKANSATTTWAVPTVVKDRRSAAVSIRSVGKIAARMLPTINA